MQSLKQEDAAAYEWLMEKGPSHNISHFKTTPQCGILLNNLCESFNGNTAILVVRMWPILSLLERVRMYIPKRFSRQRLAVNKWYGEFGPKVARIYEANKTASGYNISHWCLDQQFQVNTTVGGVFAFDLACKTCSCRMGSNWDPLLTCY